MTFSDKNVKPQNILTITRGLIQRANELVEEYVFELIEENRDLRKQLTSALSDLEHEEKRAHELDVEAQELIEQNRKLQKKIDAHER